MSASTYYQPPAGHMEFDMALFQAFAERESQARILNDVAKQSYAEPHKALSVLKAASPNGACEELIWLYQAVLDQVLRHMVEVNREERRLSGLEITQVDLSSCPESPKGNAPSAATGEALDLR
ncbi:MAG: hypothetical protein QHC81_04010 [Achromobacter sp.]|nr:hypothetical protein [Achromobacter sp.]